MYLEKILPIFRIKKEILIMFDSITLENEYIANYDFNDFLIHFLIIRRQLSFTIT